MISIAVAPGAFIYYFTWNILEHSIRFYQFLSGSNLFHGDPKGSTGYLAWFCKIPWDSAEFHEVPWKIPPGSAMFYHIP
jgi:hypothetical protein